MFYMFHFQCVDNVQYFIYLFNVQSHARVLMLNVLVSGICFIMLEPILQEPISICGLRACIHVSIPEFISKHLFPCFNISILVSISMQAQPQEVVSMIQCAILDNVQCAVSSTYNNVSILVSELISMFPVSICSPISKLTLICPCSLYPYFRAHWHMPYIQYISKHTILESSAMH